MCLEKLDKFEQLSGSQDFKEIVESAREIYNDGFVNTPENKNNNIDEGIMPESNEEEEDEKQSDKIETPHEQLKEKPEKKDQKEGSFFDQLD